MGKPIGKHNDTIERYADGSLRYRRFSETCLEESTARRPWEDDRAMCEKIAGAAVRSTSLPRYRSENRSVIVGCRIYQRRQRRKGSSRVRAPPSTSDNRRFPAGPRTTSRPLPGRARSAAPTARKKCTGHIRARVYVCVYVSVYVRMYVLERPATETRRDSGHTIADAHIYAHVHACTG